MVAYTTFLATLTTFLVGTNAVVVDYYADQNCNQQVDNRNVYDNSCATGIAGYQSFIIRVGPNDPNQIVTAYSRDACAGPTTACVQATTLNQCIVAVNGDGGSNAMSSSTGCGVA